MIDEEEKVDSKLASIERVDIWPVGNKLMNLYRFLLSQGKAWSFQYSKLFNIFDYRDHNTSLSFKYTRCICITDIQISF